jgi:hypothetical protein
MFSSAPYLDAGNGRQSSDPSLAKFGPCCARPSASSICHEQPHERRLHRRESVNLFSQALFNVRSSDIEINWEHRLMCSFCPAFLDVAAVFCRPRDRRFTIR